MNGMPALQMVASVAPADERISWRARGDIGSGMHQGLEGTGAASLTKAVWWGMRLANLFLRYVVLSHTG